MIKSTIKQGKSTSFGKEIFTSKTPEKVAAMAKMNSHGVFHRFKAEKVMETRWMAAA